MLTLYFPGNSVHNKSELESFSELFKQNDVLHHAQEWDHWVDESKEFDEEAELEKLKEVLKTHDNQIKGVLGKSIGTYFSAKALRDLGIKPEFVVLMGIPTGIEPDRLAAYQQALKDLDTDVYVIQNDKDPYGPVNEVEKLLEGVDYTKHEKEADNHIYQYADDVWELIRGYYV